MTTYYVSKSGSNSADGSSSNPWRTISYAMDSALRAGDEVVVRPGLYTEQIYISRGGSAAGQVTLRSEVEGAAQIKAPGGAYSTVNVRADYVTVEGFDIQGGTGHGVDVESSHHTEILNNTVHDSGGSGIQFNYSEFILIEGNNVYGNAGTNGYQTSGISVYQARNITGDTDTEGYRIVVRNNVSHHNIETAAISGGHTDGNGIIIDDNQSTQTAGFPNYTYPTLVENNLVYSNGGKGIQVTWSDNVTVRNNTAWHNNTDPLNPGTWRGELSNAQSSNNTWINNIAVVDPSLDRDNRAIDNTSYGGYSNDNVVWVNNLTFNGTPGAASVRTDGGNAAPSASNGNLLGVDPRFVNPGTDFELQAGSPAVGAGTTSRGVAATDLEGGPRQVGVVDLGALELDDGSPTPTPTPPPAPVNIAPDARDDFGFTTPAGAALVIQADALLANDIDTDPLTVTGVSGASGGTAVLTAAGNVRFVPSAGFSGVAGFDYSVSDGKGGADTAHATLVVAAPPPEPTPDPEPEPEPEPTPEPTPDPDPGQPEPGALGGAFSLWDPSDRLPIRSDYDSSAVEVGVKFLVEEDGWIEALRFHKGRGNDGEHTATLWTEDGDVIASAVFTSETRWGWQEVELSDPVAVDAGETYVVSYHAPQGRYSVSENYFDDDMDIGPITVLEDGGVYAYGPQGSFPVSTYKESNYWVDMVFTTDAADAPVETEEPAAPSPTQDDLAHANGAFLALGVQGASFGHDGPDDMW